MLPSPSDDTSSCCCARPWSAGPAKRPWGRLPACLGSGRLEACPTRKEVGPMDWLLLLTGATGTYTLLFLFRLAGRLLRTPSSHAVHFSPHGGCTDIIVGELKQARHEILVLAYSFTSRP